MIARALNTLFALAMAGLLGWALISLPETTDGLAGVVDESLGQSGVSNPVTAVLLNFRGYDTLLEVGVLLLVLIAVWSLGSPPLRLGHPPENLVLGGFLRALLPVMILACGYLLWIGAFAPGGAFQGGALLGGAFLLMILGGMLGRLSPRMVFWLRFGLGMGLILFLGVALGVMAWGGHFLEYPQEQAGLLILMIEAAALISIGLTLACLFLGGVPEVTPSRVRATSRIPEDRSGHDPKPDPEVNLAATS